jgi:signal transduction histidine kinase
LGFRRLPIGVPAFSCSFESTSVNLRSFFSSIKGRPFWSLLTLIVVATALPIIFSSYVMYSRLIENEKVGIRQSLLINARTLAGLVDNEIETHIAIGLTLARSSSLQQSNLGVFWNEARMAMEIVPGSTLSLSSPDGQMILSTSLPMETALPLSPDPNLIALALASKAPQVSNVTTDPISKRLTAYVEVPVFRQGEPLYVIAITLPPSRFLELINNKFNRGEIVGIVDRNKKFVARIPDHQAKLGVNASAGWSAAMDLAPEGFARNKVLEGDWSITGYAQTKHAWTVGVAQLERVIDSPTSNILRSSVALFAAFAALSFALVFAVARNANGSMKAIAQSARELGHGQRVEELKAPFAEAQTISRALAQASVELANRREALARLNSGLESKVAERTQELVAEMARRETAETTLRQAQKIETIGQLTGGIAHDFNNMLTIIMGNLDTVQRRIKNLDGGLVLAKPVEAALQGSRNAARLTHRLLAFSRQQALEPNALALNSVISGMSDMLIRSVGEAIKIETVTSAGLWLVFADANQVENSLVNLVVNARDAMPNGGKITIETANVYLDQTYANQFGDIEAGQYVLLSVTDSGAGIAADKIEKIFEPFFTTKAPGKGTGLGLSMIHGFLKQSGGHVRVYSELGHGTTVKLYFPRLLESKLVVSVPAGPFLTVVEPPRAKPGETILLVEDDPGVREFSIGVLEDLGYNVIAAVDGTEAFDFYKKAKRVDLLFTDVVLGGEWNGRQLADEILKLEPSLPVLFTTGYTSNAIFHQGRLDSGVNLLNKPFTLRDVAEKIRFVLDSK